MGISGLPPNMPDIPGMPDMPNIPNTPPPTGHTKLSNMQLQMKAQEVPDTKAIEQWRKLWNAKFPPSQQFSEPKFQQFIGGLFKFLQYLIKQEKQEASQASQDLKKSETGQD